MESYLLELLKNFDTPIVIIPERLLKKKTKLQKIMEEEFKKEKPNNAVIPYIA